MKNAFLPLLFILASCFAIGQAPAIQWQKSLGGSGNDTVTCTIQTNDGGYMMAGNSGSNDGDVTSGGGGCWLVKLDDHGGIQWQKSLTGSAYSIQQTIDGGYVVAIGTGDYYIVKIDAAGNMQWGKTLGGSKSDRPASIQQTTDGGYIVAGSSESNDGDVTGHHEIDYFLYPDFWVVKLDNAGNLQWQQSLGGAEHDAAASVKQTSDGGYIVAGMTWFNFDEEHGFFFYLVIKLDASGNTQWQKMLGGTNHSAANSVQQTSDGGYIVAGRSSANNGNVTGNHGSYDYWVVKLFATGDIQWQKSLGGAGLDQATSIQETIDGGYILAGGSSSKGGDVTDHHESDPNNYNFDFWVVKLDPVANIQWQKSLGGFGDETAISIQQTTDFGYIVAGSSNSNDGDVTGNHGGDDYWIVKLAPDFTTPLQLLQFTAQSKGQSAILNWQTASEKEVSHFNIQRSMDGIHFSTLSKVYAAGNSTSLKTYSYTDPDASSCGNKIYYRLQTMDKNGSTSYSKVVNVSWNAMETPVRIYPNPAKDILHVEGKQLQSITLTDLLGRVVMSRSLAGTDVVNINLTGLAKGQYWVIVKNKSGNVHTEKLVVQ